MSTTTKDDFGTEYIEFTVTCRMSARWVPPFLGMLRYMQRLGNVGASRTVSLFADGDGDFQPKFTWDSDLPEPTKSPTDNFEDVTFDRAPR